MGKKPRVSLVVLLSRWIVGMGLISWRYLWATTPLHRSEERLSTAQTPPPLPASVSGPGMQPWQSGVGPMYRRVFRVRVVGARQDAAALMRTVVGDLERLMPREVVRLHRGRAERRPLRPGDELVVDMPGPWNGPVRVVVADATRLQLTTRAGHLESGQIEFRAHDTDDHGLVFEIEAWSRAADRKVGLLYSRLRLAKEIQLNMWVRFCLAAARESGGRLQDGVEIQTTVSPAPAG